MAKATKDYKTLQFLRAQQRTSWTGTTERYKTLQFLSIRGAGQQGNRTQGRGLLRLRQGIDGSVHWFCEPLTTSALSWSQRGPRGREVNFGEGGYGIRFGWWDAQ